MSRTDLESSMIKETEGNDRHYALMNSENIKHDSRALNNLLIKENNDPEVNEQDSKLFNSNRNLNEESINLKINENKVVKKASNGSILLKNESEVEKIKFNSATSEMRRRETFMYDNLSIKVRGFNCKNVSVFQQFDNFLDKRRYNRANVDKGKGFFKIRYIKEKFEELMNMNNVSGGNNMSNMNINTRETRNQRRDSIKSDKENVSIGTIVPLNTILNEDKNAIKFNSLFLQKLEKAIFSFNLKKYEDSYNYLLGSGIVKNEEEFGEFLLVITGFDKFIVGDFLAKEKVPNKEKKVLKGFMNALDFRSIKFLEAFRFLLSRLNLPKDASLILEIIDAFSTVFYEDNKNSNNFKDVNSIYLLASTILALNTMFSRSDIVNMKVLKKEQFIKMNENVNKNVLEVIYDDLREYKMDIVYDYNEVVYKRLNIEHKDFFHSEEAFNKLKGIEREHSQHNNIQSSESSSMFNEMKGEEIISMLKLGEVFTKYGKYGDPHPRIVKLTDDERRIIWYSLGGCSCFTRTKFIEVSEIKDVYIGGTSSKIFERFHIPHDFDSLCFSISSRKRSLDLRKNDENICRKWFHAIKFILKRTKSIAELKNKNNLKDYINKKEIVSDIWKTEILPNWHVYRKFVIMKGKGSIINAFREGGTDNGNNNNIFLKKNKEKFAKIISKTVNKYNEKILDDKDKSEFLYLWTLGIPEWLRKKIWSLVIGNESGVTENLFNFHLKQVESVNFEELTKVLAEGVINDTNVQNSILNNYNTISLTNLQTIKLKSKLHVSQDPILNEIINDVIKITKKLSLEIKEVNSDADVFMYDLFRVVRVFTLFRPDITYSKQISYISAVLLLNSENYYSAFVSLVNFAIPSFVMKFLIRDEIYIRIRLDFFEKLMKTYLPSVYKHFVKMDVTTSLYFFKWIENIFIKTFKYETLLRIWDIYLLKGEVFLYEVSLCIMKVQEKDLTRFTIKDILKNLKKVSIHINEDEFFDMLQEIDISEDYKQLIYENSLAREKGVLFQSFMIEWM